MRRCQIDEFVAGLIRSTLNLTLPPCTQIGYML
nr:MAG TPA: hypothetical protein [Caudoviricetes sp.]